MGAPSELFLGRLRRSRLVSRISAIRHHGSPLAQRKGSSGLVWLRRRWSLVALSVLRLTAYTSSVDASPPPGSAPNVVLAPPRVVASLEAGRHTRAKIRANA